MSSLLRRVGWSAQTVLVTGTGTSIRASVPIMVPECFCRMIESRCFVNRGSGSAGWTSFDFAARMESAVLAI